MESVKMRSLIQWLCPYKRGKWRHRDWHAHKEKATVVCCPLERREHGPFDTSWRWDDASRSWLFKPLCLWYFCYSSPRNLTLEVGRNRAGRGSYSKAKQSGESLSNIPYRLLSSELENLSWGRHRGLEIPTLLEENSYCSKMQFETLTWASHTPLKEESLEVRGDPGYTKKPRTKTILGKGFTNHTLDRPVTVNGCFSPPWEDCFPPDQTLPYWVGGD